MFVTCNSLIVYKSDTYNLNVTFDSTPTPWIGSIQVPQFNRNNTLKSFYISCFSNGSSQTNATNVETTPAVGHLYTSFDIRLSVGGTFIMSNYYEIHSPSYTLYQYQSFSDPYPITKSSTIFSTITTQSILNLFIGSTTTNIDIDTTSQLWSVATESLNPHTNGGNVLRSYVTPPTASLSSVTVKYYYQ